MPKLIQMLEGYFGTSLEPNNLRKFKEISATDAKSYLERMRHSLRTDGDFDIPQREPYRSRPMIWHEYGNAARYGGDALFSSADAEAATGSLRDLILIHDQVLVCDPFDYFFEGIARGSGKDRARYERYIEFLAYNRRLVDENILLFASDRLCYENQPVNDSSAMKDLRLEAFIKSHIGKFSQSFDTDINIDQIEVAASARVYGRFNAYADLLDNYNADVFLDSPVRALTANAMAATYEGGQFETHGPAVGVLKGIGKELSNQDLLDLRINSEAFSDWRRAFSIAQKETDPRLKIDIFESALERLNQEEASVLAGPARTLTFGSISAVAAYVALGPAATLAASIVTAIVQSIAEYRSSLSEIESEDKAILRNLYGNSIGKLRASSLNLT